MRGNKFLYILPALLPVIAIICAGCNTSAVETTPPQKMTQSVTEVTSAEANALIQSNAENPDFIIIDVRTPEEYNAGHLENARLINYNSASFIEEISKLARDKKYLIYCRTGNRSSGARDKMTELGFLDIYHLTHGITEWTAQGYPVVK